MTIRMCLILLAFGIVIGMMIGNILVIAKRNKKLAEGYNPVSLITKGHRSKPTPPPPEKHHFTIRLFRDNE